MKPFGWAYLGCGGIAHTTARELVKAGAGRIVAAWNRTPEKADAFVAEFGGKAYATAREAILAPEVEGVYIAVNPNMHAELIRLCVRHHKPVLCEKPFTVNVQEAEDVLAFARTEGVYVSEAMWTWHNKVAQTVRGWLQSGRIGEVKRVYCSFSPNLYDTHPRLRDPEMIGGALLDIGVYNIRYCYELFGMPESIECTDSLMRGGVDSHETVYMRYPGFTAKLDIGIDVGLPETCEIEGTKGVIRVPDFHMASAAVLESDRPEHFEDPSLHYAVQFERVGEEIRGGLTSGGNITAQSTIDVMKLMDECRRQMDFRYSYEM
ncbi:MAG: Gfo/Idh/MocA family oxidoreductase [Christensenellaceae bacterium]|nr:Gfo/Idh/MocA family oxidoreductase [Christensenellaceae bacterium]